MKFPIFSVVQFVDSEGYLTIPMQDYMDLMSQALMGGLSDDGWTLPSLTDVQLAAIAPSMPAGTMWYDNVNDEVVVKIGSTLMQVSVTTYP